MPDDNFSVLFKKAVEDVEACETLMEKASQHENAGKHLHAAVEKFFKCYLDICKVVNVPNDGKNGHDLSLLLRMLKQTDFPAESFKPLLKLQPYDSSSGYQFIMEERQINLKSVLPLVSELKTVVVKKYRDSIS